MTNPSTHIRTRGNTATKERATDERAQPFTSKAPNATTRKAMAELKAGKGKRFDSVEALMADLHADN